MFKNLYSDRTETGWQNAGNGFLLVEVLISIAILGAMTVALVGIMQVASNYVTDGSKETVAVELSRMRLEEISILSRAGIEERGFKEEGGVEEDYGEIEGYSAFRRTSLVKEKDMPVKGEENTVPVFHVKVKVFWNGEEVKKHERSMEQEILLAR